MSDSRNANLALATEATPTKTVVNFTRCEQLSIAFCGIGFGTLAIALGIVMIPTYGFIGAGGATLVGLGFMCNRLSCESIAVSKGYPPDYGGMAAMLFLPGIVALLLMTDRRNGEK